MVQQHCTLVSAILSDCASDVAIWLIFATLWLCVWLLLFFSSSVVVSIRNARSVAFCDLLGMGFFLFNFFFIITTTRIGLIYTDIQTHRAKSRRDRHSARERHEFVYIMRRRARGCSDGGRNRRIAKRELFARAHFSFKSKLRSSPVGPGLVFLDSNCARR